MKIEYYIEHLKEWDSETRERYLNPLMGILSEVSLATLRDFQKQHFQRAIENKDPDYEAFKVGQNEEIIKCLQLEMSEIGKGVRETLGLEPLTLDTEVDVAIIHPWYSCPNCQGDYRLANGDVCPCCGKHITLENYPQDEESIYQHGEI